MNPLKQLASQTAIYGLSSIIGRLLNYFLVPLYTRVFLPEQYGVVTEMYAYISFLIIVFTYGMETAYFRFAETEANKEKVFSTSLLSLIFSSLFFVGLFFLFAKPLSNILQYPNHTEYIYWFALILALDAITSIPFAKLRQQNKAKKFATIKLLNIFINIGFNIFFLVVCPYFLRFPDSPILPFIKGIYNVNIGVGYVFISNLIASAVTLILLLPEMLDIHFDLDKQLCKRMLIYALPLLVAGLAGMVNETMDRILLKYLLIDKSTAMEQLGIYGACYKLSILMTLFIQTFRYAAEPFFFSHSSKENAKQIYADVMKYFVITCSFIFLGIMLYMDVVKYFIGAKYYSGLKVVPILLLANLCLGVFFNLSIWYKLTGKTRFGAYLTIFGAVVTLVLNYWWIPIMGYMGAAWATLICYASMMVVSYFIGQKYYPVNYNLKKILGYLGLSLLLFFASKYLQSLEILNHKMLLAGNSFLLLLFLTIVFISEKPKKMYL